MTFNLEHVLAGKRGLRQKLRALPLVEKLRLLDALRERALTLRRSAVGPAEPASVKEPPAPYVAEPTCPPKLQRRRKLMKAKAGRAKRRVGKSA